MYYVGLIQKFKVNRPLEAEDRKMRLRQDRKFFQKPTSALSVTKINSTYLEVVDKFYSWKGGLTALGLFIVGFSIAAAVAPGYIMFIEHWPDLVRAQRIEASVVFALIVVVISVPFFCLGFWTIRRESFRYTHYPIRLNRKARKVYVFRLDGTVLETPWDDLYITMGPAAPSRIFGTDWDLRAHVLDADGDTVRETFAFGEVSDPENLRHYFSYLQRYMEEGPEAVAQYTPHCLDISDKRETASFGFKRLWLNMHGWIAIQVLMLPLFVFSALGRVIAMRTSRIPQWPTEVEAANRIQPGDPWVRDARTHPAR